MRASTSIKDQASATASLQDNQCFGYDGLRRLRLAWTAASGDCGIAQESIQASDVGGAAPYWSQYSYDPLGNRTTLTQHALTGGSTAVTSYTHGAGTAGPHQLTGSSLSVGGVVVGTASYGYDGAGNRTSRRSEGVSTGYAWDAEGRLAGVEGEEYIYDTAGIRMVRSDAGGLSVYLPGGQEIRISGAAVSATRYYSFAGASVAVRSGAGLAGVSSLVCDPQGTPVAAVPNTVWSAGSVSRVYSDPFGQTRTGSASLPGDRFFLGAVHDPGTGLTLLGARYYDEQAGIFISVDPVLDPVCRPSSTRMCMQAITR